MCLVAGSVVKSFGETVESDLYSLRNFVGSACSIRAIFGLPKRGSVFPCCTLEIHLPDWWDCNILLNSCPCPVFYRTPDFIVNSFRRVSPIREHFSCYFFLWSIFVGEALLGLPTWLGRLQPCLPVNTSVTGPDLNTNTTDSLIVSFLCVTSRLVLPLCQEALSFETFREFLQFSSIRTVVNSVVIHFVFPVIFCKVAVLCQTFVFR